MSKMSKYEEKIKEFKSSSNSTGYSKPVDNALAQALLESRDFERKTYVTKGDDIEEKVSKPVDEFWTEVEKMVQKNCGLDAADVKDITRGNVSKKMASAFSELANSHIVGCLETGKNYNIDPTRKDRTKAVLSFKDLDQKDVKTSKIEKQEDGTYKSVPTGDTVRYAKRTEIAVSNKHTPKTRYKV